MLRATNYKNLKFSVSHAEGYLLTADWEENLKPVYLSK
jgi:hypothetical protein